MTVTVEKKKNLPHNYQLVVSVLGEGKEKSITTTDIMKFTGINNKRDVHEIIERLVVKYGYVIGSSRKGVHRGYYLISNKDELKETLYTYNRQIQSMLNRYRALQGNYSKRAN